MRGMSSLELSYRKDRLERNRTAYWLFTLPETQTLVRAVAKGMLASARYLIPMLPWTDRAEGRYLQWQVSWGKIDGPYHQRSFQALLEKEEKALIASCEERIRAGLDVRDWAGKSRGFSISSYFDWRQWKDKTLVGKDFYGPARVVRFVGHTPNGMPVAETASELRPEFICPDYVCPYGPCRYTGVFPPWKKP